MDILSHILLLIKLKENCGLKLECLSEFNFQVY